MSFTVDDFRDLMRLLEERPEWRNELRHLLLSDALLAMPEQLAALRLDTEQRFQELLAQMTDLVQENRLIVQAQQQLTQRVDDLARRLDTLMQRVDDLARRLDTLTQRVDDLTRRLDTLTQRVDDLARRLDTLTQRVDDLARRLDTLTQRVNDLTVQIGALTLSMDTMAIDLADVKGDSLERRYRERAPAYFGRLIRRSRALSPEDVAALVDDAVERGLLSDLEGEELTWADVVVRGKRRTDGTDVYLVAEISWRIDGHDVERAARRAALLQRLGLPTQPVVAGKTMTDEANRLVQLTQVVTLLDGSSSTS